MANKKSTGKKVGAVAALLTIGAGILMLKNFAGKKKSLEYLDFTLSSVKPDLSSPLAPKLTITATISNPNSTPVPIVGIFGKVLYNNNLIANFQNSTPVQIGGKKTSSVTLEANIKALSFVTTLINIIKNPSAKKEVLIDGMFQTGFYEQPFTQSINI